MAVTTITIIIIIITITFHTTITITTSHNHHRHHPGHHWYWHGGSGGDWGGNPGYLYDPNFYYDSTGVPSVQYNETDLLPYSGLPLAPGDARTTIENNTFIQNQPGLNNRHEGNNQPYLEKPTHPSNIHVPSEFKSHE